MTLKQLKKKLRVFISYFAKNKNQDIFIPAYRIIEILQDSDDDYIVKVQVINKSMTFNIKPEEILAEDEIVNRFSPCDIRTLTYLGYLGINSPKYKILAKRLSENDQKLVFALKKKGNTKLVTKTADEIIKEKDILDNLNAKDAHIIGYTLATETAKAEKKQKEEALKEIAENRVKEIK